jgi:hypothetical protein
MDRRSAVGGAAGTLALRRRLWPPAKPAESNQLALLPPWLEAPVAAEPRPPRPLAPSALGEELSADPPWPPGARAQAARRGVLMHRLLERLPDVAPADRKGAAQAWLARAAADLAAPARAEMTDAALAVLANKAWADLFAPGALAEVPIAATVGGQVVAGTIDRLLVEPERIRLVDFKTARRPPGGLDEVPGRDPAADGGLCRRAGGSLSGSGSGSRAALYPGADVAGDSGGPAGYPQAGIDRDAGILLTHPDCQAPSAP